MVSGWRSCHAAQVVTAIGPEETAGQLAGRLAEIGAAALVEAISLRSGGAARPAPQDHTHATYAPKLDREQAHIVWQRDSAELVRQIRAFDPAPGAWTELDGNTLKIFGAQVAPGSGAPGTVLETSGRLVIAAGSGAVAVSEVQPAGKTRISVEAWLRGRGVTAGRRLI